MLSAGFSVPCTDAVEIVPVLIMLRLVATFVVRLQPAGKHE